MKVAVAMSPSQSEFAPLFFQGNIERGLACIADAGLDAIELSLKKSSEVDAAHIASGARDLGLLVSAVGTGRVFYEDGLSLTASTQSTRQAAQDRLVELLDTASELGAPYLIIGGVRGQGDMRTGIEMPFNALLVEGLAHLADQAKGHDVTLLVEPINRYETRLINTLDDGAKVLHALGSPHSVGLLADTFHMNIEEPDIQAALYAHARDIRYVHVADSNRQVPGMGHIPFTPLLRLLSAIGYDDYLGIEALPLPDDVTAIMTAAQVILPGLRRVALQSNGGGERTT